MTIRRTRRFGTLAAAVVVAAPVAAAFANGAGIAGATPDSGGTVLAFSQILRRCDFTSTQNGPTGYGRATGVVRSTGSTVSAAVQLATALPNTRYDIRLIQAPRPSSASCVGGDPGVAAGTLNTDGAGAATLTLQDAIAPNATGAWVFITRPDAFSQNPAEFYTTDFVAPI